MKIKSVEAFWVHIPIPPERQHTSDFGRTLSFDGTWWASTPNAV